MFFVYRSKTKSKVSQIPLQDRKNIVFLDVSQEMRQYRCIFVSKFKVSLKT